VAGNSQTSRPRPTPSVALPANFILVDLIRSTRASNFWKAGRDVHGPPSRWRHLFGGRPFRRWCHRAVKTPARTLQRAVHPKINATKDSGTEGGTGSCREGRSNIAAPDGSCVTPYRPRMRISARLSQVTRRVAREQKAMQRPSHRIYPAHSLADVNITDPVSRSSGIGANVCLLISIPTGVWNSTPGTTSESRRERYAEADVVLDPHLLRSLPRGCANSAFVRPCGPVCVLEPPPPRPTPLRPAAPPPRWGA